MSSTNCQLLTPQNAEELVAALNSLKQRESGVVSFAMRAGMVRLWATLHCDYDRSRNEVRCVFNGNEAMTTTFPVSSPAIIERGEPSLENSFPPPGIGVDDHETRWKVSVHGDLQVYCSRVVVDDNLLVVWTDWRSFTPGEGEHSRPLPPIDVKMFGKICPKW